MGVLLLLGLAPLGGASPPELWLYDSTNLLGDENVSRLEEVWRRAAMAGYRIPITMQ